MRQVVIMQLSFYEGEKDKPFGINFVEKTTA